MSEVMNSRGSVMSLAHSAADHSRSPRSILWSGARQRIRATLGQSTHAALMYLLAITAAEVVTIVLHPLLGLMLHIVALIALLIQSARAADDRKRSFLLSLMIVPIIRIVSLGLPLAAFGQTWWYALTSVPLFAASVLIIRALALRRREIGLTLPQARHWLPTLAVACSGIPLGIVEFHILRPTSIVDSTSVRDLIVPALVLLIGTGLLEELIFRGILQTVAARIFSTSTAIVYVSSIFAVLHTGHNVSIDILFVFGVALYFASVVRVTHTLIGVSIAHGVTNIMLFIVLPLLNQ